MTSVFLPGQGAVDAPGIYFAFFPSEKLVIEPEVGLRHQSSGGDGLTQIGLTGRLEYLFRGSVGRSPYVMAQAGLLRLSGFDDSANGYSIGGGVGYRTPVAGSLALSVEGRYRRGTGEDFFEEDMNEFALVVALGAVIRR